jgi:hypothetical protein
MKHRETTWNNMRCEVHGTNTWTSRLDTQGSRLHSVRRCKRQTWNLMIRQQKLCLLDWKRRTRRLIVAADHYASSYFDSKASPRGGVSSRQQRRGRKFMAETNRIHRTTSKSCGNQETQQKIHLRNRKILLCTALRQHISVAKGPHR